MSEALHESLLRKASVYPMLVPRPTSLPPRPSAPSDLSDPACDKVRDSSAPESSVDCYRHHYHHGRATDFAEVADKIDPPNTGVKEFEPSHGDVERKYVPENDIDPMFRKDSVDPKSSTLFKNVAVNMSIGREASHVSHISSLSDFSKISGVNKYIAIRKPTKQRACAIVSGCVLVVLICVGASFGAGYRVAETHSRNNAHKLLSGPSASPSVSSTPSASFSSSSSPSPSSSSSLTAQPSPSSSVGPFSCPASPLNNVECSYTAFCDRWTGRCNCPIARFGRACEFSCWTSVETRLDEGLYYMIDGQELPPDQCGPEGRCGFNAANEWCEYKYAKFSNASFSVQTFANSYDVSLTTSIETVRMSVDSAPKYEICHPNTGDYRCRAFTYINCYLGCSYE